MGGLVDVRETDHHHRFQQSHSRSSRRGDKSYRLAGGGGGGTARKAVGASDHKPVARDRVSGRARGEGNGRLRKQIYTSNIDSDSSYDSGSPIEENSFTLELRRSSSMKAGGTPIKALIDEEMSRETEIRHQSPNVIAKLMGLDTLPPPQISSKQQKEKAGCFQKTSSIGFQGSYTSDEDHSCQVSTSEHQEFKDVFEMAELSNSEKHKNRPVWKGMPRSKQNEKELDFIRQKFMDAKRLSTDEMLQNSKELNEALEVLDSNKDLFLKFLQEPNYLSAKHLQDLKCFPPSPQASHITILKSTKGTKYGSSEVCSTSERKAERYAHMPKDVISSFRKPTTSRVSHSLKEHGSSHSRELLKSQYTSKADACLHPTRIVVLKPSLEKAQGSARTVSLPRSTENLQFSFRRHREFQLSGIQELHEEGRQRHKLFDNTEVTRHKSKGSREIAREITEQMRLRQIRDESSCIVSGASSLNNSEAYQRTSDNCDGWNSNYQPSSSYSSESSVSREARKRLSERWKMTQRFQEVGLSSRDSSTLGEMLALSDTETPRTTFDSLSAQKVSNEKSARDEVLATQGRPLGISSRDGWKDGCFINLPRSKSLPASSLVYGTPKPSSKHSDGGSDNCSMLKDGHNFGPKDSLHGNFNRRRSSHRSFKCGRDMIQSFNSGGEENKLPVREIHVNPEETRNRIRANNLAEEKPMLSELSGNTIANIGHIVENSLHPESIDAKLPYISSKEQVQQSAKDIESSVSDHVDKSIEETSCEHLQEDILPSRCERTESGSSLSSKEAEQPSPVSVLEPPYEEETSSSGCFGRISADLQELRMQLQLLKLESEDTFADEPQVLLSDEDTGGVHHSLLQIRAIEQAFRDDEERDFSYLLDVLVGSGIHGVDQDRFFDACYLPEYPVDPSVFEKLEMKYGVLSWSRSERKLLFDLINSILAQIIAPCMDLHPWVKSKRRLGPMWPCEELAEEVWRLVVGQRKELSRGNPEDKVLDPGWLELVDDVNMIGREIERMLKEDLLEELVSEFIVPQQALQVQ